MENRVEFLIEYFQASSKELVKFGGPEDKDIIASMKDTAKFLSLFRSTLISIAKCQGGIGSHQAQEALKKAGYCAHTQQTYVSITKAAGKNPGQFTCHACKEHCVEKLVPFQ